MILCPTRGGQRSYPNQDRAISLAREHEADLLFLYVSDVRFLDQFQSPVLIDMAEELDGMGEFLLAMAQERAEKAGVKALTTTRRGGFHAALAEVVSEYDVDILVLGSPTEEAEEADLTTTEYLADLCRFMSSEAGIEVFVLRDGEIAQHFTPGEMQNC